MDKTVGIIGCGWVGTSVAISLLHSGAADALWLHDLRPGLAEGEAMDLAHGAAFYPRCQVQAVDIDRMRHCQVVVVAAGRGGKPGESRLDLLRDNARVVAGIGRLLAGFGGIVVMVTNPVDVLTQVMTEASGLPPFDPACKRRESARTLARYWRSAMAPGIGYLKSRAGL